MSLPAYLLSLANLHAAAPGVLDVVFGPDGEHEDAPDFACPLLGHMVPAHVQQKAGIFLGWVRHGVWSEPMLWLGLLSRNGYVFTAEWPVAWCALDLRVPSVAARLAGLCARALLPSGRSSATWDLIESDGGTFMLCAAVRHGITWTWDSNGHARGNAPSIHGAEEYDRCAFLRALTLALAPRIAALRTTASPR